MKRRPSDEFVVGGSLLSWEEIGKILQLPKVTNVESRIVPCVGHVVSVWGGKQAAKNVKEFLHGAGS